MNLKITLILASIMAITNSLHCEENTVEPLLGTLWHVYQWPYNAYFPESEDGIEGHLGNACGPTAMAQMIKYWDSPVNGRGSLEFTDYYGYHWYANFDTTQYQWDDMPFALGMYATEDQYRATATLMYHCAVAMDDYYGTGRSLEILKDQMVEYFRFDENAEVLYREDFSPSEWDALFRNELDNNRPILIEGWGPGSAPPGEPGNHFGHYFICDGYNEEGNFHIQWNFGNSDGYYPLYEFRDGENIDFSTYNWALMGFVPENYDSITENQITIPENYLVVSTYPNPFNAALRIDFSLKTATTAEICIYNINGQQVFQKNVDVKNKTQESLIWNAASLSTGTYYCRVQADDKFLTKKVILVK